MNDHIEALAYAGVSAFIALAVIGLIAVFLGGSAVLSGDRISHKTEAVKPNTIMCAPVVCTCPVSEKVISKSKGEK